MYMHMQCLSVINNAFSLFTPNIIDTFLWVTSRHSASALKFLRIKHSRQCLHAPTLLLMWHGLCVRKSLLQPRLPLPPVLVSPKGCDFFWLNGLPSRTVWHVIKKCLEYMLQLGCQWKSHVLSASFFVVHLNKSERLVCIGSICTTKLVENPVFNWPHRHRYIYELHILFWYKFQHVMNTWYPARNIRVNTAFYCTNRFLLFTMLLKVIPCICPK